MFRSICFATIVTVMSAFGCTQSPKPSDPEVARATLRQVLDAWKKGDTPESLESATPPIIVSDRQWQKGAKLLEYEISDKTSENGFDQHFSVSLTLAEGTGKKTQKAAYDVSTHPKLVVVRAEGP